MEALHVKHSFRRSSGAHGIRRSVRGVVGAGGVALLTLTIFGCSPGTSADEVVATKTQALVEDNEITTEEFPYLKLLFRHEAELRQKTEDLSTTVLFRSSEVSTPAHAPDMSEVESGVTAVSYGGLDWIAWWDGDDELKIKPLGAADSYTYSIRHAVGLQAAPAIATYNGDLVASWVEDDRILMSRSSTEGRSWSDPWEIHGTAALGSRVSLAEFDGAMYVAYVLNNRSVRVKKLNAELTAGVTFAVHEATADIVEGAVAMAANGDETLSLAFATAGGDLIAMHTDHPSSTWHDIYYYSRYSYLPHAPSASYAESRGKTYFYVSRATWLGYFVHRKDTENLYSNWAVNFRVNTDVQLSDTYYAPIFNSSSGATEEGFSLLAKEPDTCERRLTLKAMWAGEDPQNTVQVDHYELLVDGQPYDYNGPTPSWAGVTQSVGSPGVAVQPEQRVTIGARAYLADGTVVESNNAIPYTFEPCSEDRDVKWAFIRTGFEGGNEPVLSEAELREIAFGDDSGSVVSYFEEVTEGMISATGDVATSTARIPGPITDYCKHSDGVVLLSDTAGGYNETEDLIAGTLARDIIVTDFDEDGTDDLALLNENSHNVSVLLGTGSGSFAPATNYPAGLTPMHFATGDFDQDGHADLAVADRGAREVSILLGDGVGAFAATGTADLAPGALPSDVVAADFDSDGRDDVAVVDANNNQVSIFLSQGAGNLAPATSYNVGLEPSGAATGDFDGDGDPDLVITNGASDDVSILTNDGGAGFAPAGTLPVGNQPSSVVVADFDGDNDLDVAITNYLSESVTVMFGDGAGGFGSANDFDPGLTPFALSSADLNDDGIVDLYLVNRWQGSVSILLGQAGGTFAPPSRFDAGSTPVAVATGDFNQDGHADLVTANYSGVSDGDLVCDTTKISSAVFEHVRPEFENAGYDEIFWLIGDMQTAGWAGGDIFMSGFSTPEAVVKTSIHEAGHAMGAPHAGLWKCPGDALVGPEMLNAGDGDNDGGCRILRYAQEVEPMAVGRNYYGAFFGNVFGYIESSQSLNVTQSGEYELHALQTAVDGGTVELRVQVPGIPSHTFYSLEYRQPLGWDSEATTSNDFKNVSGDQPLEGIVINLHRGGAYDVEMAMVQHLVQPGDPFYDPYRGITIELVEQLSANRARVRVSYDSDADQDPTSLTVPGNWSSSTAQLDIVEVSGTTALKTVAQGFNFINSHEFATSDLSGVTDKIAIDVMLPTNPPNPGWLGDLQVHASCPSAGVYNEWLGRAEFDGLPLGQFQKLTFTLTPSVLSAFLGDYQDCRFDLSLNVDASAPAEYYLTNLRFD